MKEHPIVRIWPAPLVALVSVIAGGLLSAVTAHAPTQPTAWASAYLVLVGGVATAGLAVGRAMLSGSQPSARRLGLELALWVAGNGFVLGGTLLSPAWLVEVGSGLMVIALGSVLAGVYRGGGNRVLRVLFMALVLVISVSIPVGLFLSHLGR